MKKNKISKKYRKEGFEEPMKTAKKVFLFLVLGTAAAFFYLEFKEIGFKSNLDKFLRTINNDLLVFLLVELFVIMFGGLLIYIHWQTWKANPNYINWDEKGIQIINNWDKKEYVPWWKVKYIRPIREESKENENYDEYILRVKGKVTPNRILQEEIGENIQKYYRDIEVEQKKTRSKKLPFYKTSWFKYLLVFFGILSVILLVMFGPEYFLGW